MIDLDLLARRGASDAPLQPLPKLLTTEQAAQVLEVDVRRVRDLITNHTIPPECIVRLGRQIRLHPEKLRAWIDAGGAALPGGWKRE